MLHPVSCKLVKGRSSLDAVTTIHVREVFAGSPGSKEAWCDKIAKSWIRDVDVANEGSEKTSLTHHVGVCVQII